MSIINRRGLLLGLASIGAFGAARADGVSGGIVNGVNDGTFGGLVNGGFFPLTGSSVDLWFAAGRYSGGTLASLTSTARATPPLAYATNSDGSLTSFAINTPRIGIGTGLLVEPSRVNLALFSDNLTGAAWTAYNSSVPSVTQTAPDGTASASQLVEALDVAQNHFVAQGSIPVTSTSVYTVSAFVQANGRTQTLIQYDDGVINIFPIFSLVDGSTVAANGATGIVAEQSINGWWRFSFLVTAAAATAAINIYTVLASAFNYNGDGVSGINLWGVQVVLGSKVSSKITTTTLAVTRASDVVTLTGAASTIMLSAAGSAICSIGTTPNAANSPRVIGDDAGFGIGILDATHAFVYDGVLLSATRPSGTAALNASKVGGSWDNTGRSCVINNGTLTTDAEIQVHGTTYYLGQGPAGLLMVDGYIQRISIFNTRIADATLKAFTV